MKQIKIKTIRLINFKGVRHAEINFNDTTTSIYGKNASGKTTVFDAFTWLLFGKNSDDKKQFNIKTLDADGNVIEKIPHEVTAILQVDGTEIRLCKRLKEKWTKRRGSSVEEFTGNEEERLYNDVPMSVRDWAEKINAICTEDVFKMITNPLYFTGLKWDKQREMLIQMAGDVTTDDIVSVNPETFGKLIDNLNGKTFDEFKREISAKKKRIKEEVDTLPSRIDERQRNVGTTYDWELLSARLHHKENKLQELDNELNTASGLTKKITDNVMQVAEERARLQAEITTYRTNAINSIKTSTQNAIRDYERKQNAVKEHENTIKQHNEWIAHYTDELANQNERREELLQEWRTIKNRTLQITEETFVCPTCGKPLDIDKIEEKQAEMTERFNRQKTADLEDNKQKGLSVKKVIESVQESIKGHTNKVEQLTIDLKKLQAEIPAQRPKEYTDAEIESYIEKDAQYNALKKALTDFDDAHKQAEENVQDNAQEEEIERMRAERNQLITDIAEIRSQLGMKKVNEENEQRIKELEKQMRSATEELARLEGIEFQLQEFTRTRIEMLEEKINSLFKFVKFKMFEQQINGGEVETCKAMVDGVPFEDLNNAMKINAGLDIINAMCAKVQMTAPIYIDNAESVNTLISTDSQVIRLVVSEDNELRVA